MFLPLNFGIFTNLFNKLVLVLNAIAYVEISYAHLVDFSKLFFGSFKFICLANRTYLTV